MSDRVGYVKIWRKSLDNPVIFKDSDHIAIWFYLLLNAVKFPKDIDFKGKRHTLKSGQFSTGRNVIAKDLKISETKVQRVLKRFESEHQIEQQTSNKCRIITILNWGLYQESEQQIEQQVNNNCTTSEQQVNTKKERKESKERKERNKYIENEALEVFEKYCELFNERNKTYHKRTQSIKNIKLLLKKNSAEELIQYAINYLNQSGNTEYCFACSNFYGRASHYKDFQDGFLDEYGIDRREYETEEEYNEAKIRFLERGRF